MRVDVLQRGVKLHGLFQMRDRGAKLTHTELRQPQVKVRVGIIGREVNHGAKVAKRLKIVPLPVLDDAFGILHLYLFCRSPEAGKQ